MQFFLHKRNAGVMYSRVYARKDSGARWGMTKDDKTMGRKSAAVELGGGEKAQEGTTEKEGWEDGEVRDEWRRRQTNGEILQKGIKESDVSQRLNRRDMA